MTSFILYLYTAIYARQISADIANRIELEIRRNRDAYMQVMTKQNREMALRFFDVKMEELTGPNGCGSAALGGAGRRCIEERQRGGKHAWAEWYRDSIDSTQPEF